MLQFEKKQAIEIWAPKVLAVSALGLSLVIFAIKWLAYAKGLGGPDLALYANALANTGPGRGVLFSAGQLSAYGFPSYLNDHFAPTLLLLVPAYKICPSPVLLLLIQSLCLPAAAYLLYKTARALNAGAIAGLLATTLYLFHPWSVAAAVDLPYGFHHDCLIPVLAFGVALSLVKNRPLWFLTLSLLLVGLKENLPYIYVLAGLGLAARKETRIFGVMALGSGLALALAALIFQTATGLPNRHVHELVSSLLHPARAGEVFSLLLRWIPILLFLPALLAPGLLCLALSEIFMLTRLWRLPGDWHSLPVLAVAALACALGLARAEAWMASDKARPWHKQAARGVALLLAVVTLAGGILNLQKPARDMVKARWRVDQARLEQALKQVPEDAALAVSNELLAHCANRKKLIWMTQWNRADFVLVNAPKDEPGMGTDMLKSGLKRAGLKMIYDDGQGLSLFGVPAR
jgi:hypothetical protein